MAKDFIDLLNHREDIHPIYYRVPIIIGGEKVYLLMNLWCLSTIC